MDVKLETDRLILREVRFDDAHEVHGLHSLPEVCKYNTIGIPKDIAITRGWLYEWIQEQDRVQRKRYVFIIECKRTVQFLGLIALNLNDVRYRSGEIWYKLHINHWGKGYATEALKKLMEYGFTHLNIRRIEAGCAVANVASVRVLERAGMIREGRKRQALPLPDGWADNYEYAILKSEWERIDRNVK